MPFSTLEKLGLEMTGPTPYIVNMADQRQITPVGQVADCEVRIGEVYTRSLTFHVLRLVTDANSYPILLGRDWLRRVDANICWSTNRSRMTFGPPHNWCTSTINPRSTTPKPQLLDGDEAIEETLETRICATGRQPINLGPIKSLGPGLYEWEDDGEFTKWLVEYPKEGSESIVQ